MNNPDILIFCSDLCWACQEAMNYFKERGLNFKSLKVEWDKNGKLKDSENASLMKEKCGENIDFVPQIIINGELIGRWADLKIKIESGEFLKKLNG